MSSSSPSGSWQDRRFMFPTGREVHEGSRRMSQSSSKSDDLAVPPAAAAPAAAAGAAPVSALPDYPVVEKKVLSNPDAWGGDRRFMGMLGKEVHQPARRMSGGSGGAAKPTVDAASPPPKSSASPPASSGGGIAGAIAGRRRVCTFPIVFFSPVPSSLIPHCTIDCEPEEQIRGDFDCD